MQKQFRIRKNSQFQYVYRRGKNQAARELSVVYLKSGRLKVGFSVSKKVGKAVTRNLVKRRLRAAFTTLIPQLKPGLYIVTARPLAAEADYQTLLRSLRYVLRKHNLFQETP
ncbi:MAG: ribonuclease P protein component [Clostridia bacterium]|nr:ribonuclease P protein component [Clostridia bacterium]